MAARALVEGSEGRIVGTACGPRERDEREEAVAVAAEERLGGGEIAARSLDQRRSRSRGLAHDAASNWSRQPVAQK